MRVLRRHAIETAERLGIERPWCMSNEDLVDALVLEGVDAEIMPSVTEPPHPTLPYPSMPTDGWLRYTLMDWRIASVDMKRTEMIRELRALGFTKLTE